MAVVRQLAVVEVEPLLVEADQQVHGVALRGRAGKKLIEVDALGRELDMISERRPIDGTNPQLSIDLNLQREVEKIMCVGTIPGRV